MSDVQLEELGDNIKMYGQKLPIYLHEGLIVDGRNRYLACTRKGIEPRVAEWDGTGSLVDFVWSMDLRRHETEGARQIMGAWYKVKKEEESRTRSIANLKVGNGENSPTASNEAVGESKRSRDEAATKFQTSASSIDRATVVIKKGVPELAKAVQSGEIKVAAAAEIATLSKEEQTEALKGGKESIKAAQQKAKAQKPKKSKSPEGAETVIDTLTAHQQKRKEQAKLLEDNEKLEETEWLLTLPPFLWLKRNNRHIFFQRAALTYLKHSTKIKSAQKALGNSDAIKAQDGSPFARSVSGFLGIKHPHYWGICGGCKGSGCAKCNQCGYDLAAGLDAVVLLNEAEANE